MNIRPQELKNLTQTGAFVGLLLLLCMVFIFFLGKESSLFDSSIVLKSQIKNVDNLKVGAAVQLKGLKVGSIKQIEFKDISVIELAYSVDSTYVPWVRKNAEVFIRTQGMLGDKYLEIDGGTMDVPSVSDGDILADGGATGIGKFLSQGENIIETASNIMSRLNQVLEQINENGQIQTTFKNLRQSSEHFNSILSQIDGKKINDSVNNLNHMSKQLDEMASRISKGPGAVHSLIYDNSVYDDLRTLLGGAQRSQVLKYFIRESIKKGTKLDGKEEEK